MSVHEDFIERLVIAVVFDRDGSEKKMIATYFEEFEESDFMKSILKSPPLYMYVSLRHITLCEQHRILLIEEMAKHFKWAYRTLLSVKDLGKYREMIIEKISNDPSWVQLTLNEVILTDKERTFLESKT